MTPRPGRVRGPPATTSTSMTPPDAADADLICVAPKRDYTAPRRRSSSWCATRTPAGRSSSPTAPLPTSWVRPGSWTVDGARPTGVTSRVRGPLSAGAGRSRRPLRAGRHDRDRCRRGGRARRRAAPDASAVRCPHAAAAARRMVVPAHRDGGQAQFISRQVPDCDAETLGPLLAWVGKNLNDDLSVETLARRRPHVARTFAAGSARRRVRPRTRGSPAAAAVGRGAARADRPSGRLDRRGGRLRERRGAAPPLHRPRGVSPQQYRRTFGDRDSRRQDGSLRRTLPWRSAGKMQEAPAPDTHRGCSRLQLVDQAGGRAV